MVVGATVEEKGFDLAVQAGAVGDLLDDARRLVPSLEEYELVDTTTGLRPGSPDNAPIVGATDIAGLVVATGHYRNGILLAPVTAHEVVGLLLATADPGPWRPAVRRRVFAPFGPDRFAPMARPTGGRGHGAADRGRSDDPADDRGRGQRDPLGRARRGTTVADLVARVVRRRPAGSPWPATATSSPGAAGSRTPVVAGDRIEIVTAAAGG